MKFTITRRYFSSLPSIDVEIDASLETASHGVKLGAAIKVVIKSGADLRGADLRGAYLRGADLHGANLRGADLRGAYLRGADLRGADLGDADLGDADLRGAYLRGAYLRGANLRDADLGDADLGDCPAKIENIHQAIYAAASKPDALNMGDWHTCETTHCRAGWAVHLAGDAGRALEWAMGTPAAATVIYMASDPTLERVPDFYCSNEEALEDMRTLAEAEAGATDA